MDGSFTGAETGTGPDSSSLDPNDWRQLRALGYRMLDDLFDDLEVVRDGPVWRPMPAEVRSAWQEPLPRDAAAADDVYADYRRLVAPYGVGNRHPRFFGWVHGGGTAIGMLAEMLAGGLNANCGGRDHAPIAVERQVVRWAAEMLGFPGGAGGLLLSGSSMANFVAVLAARRVALGAGVRETGIKGVRLTAYASKRAHMCVARALDMAGLGAASLRLIETNCYGRLSAGPLSTRLESDRAAGMTPFLVVGTAGCVDTGAIDDLEGLASFCRAQQIWFHVDGAFGALAMLSPRFRTRLRGIEQADSVAFDFHKWMQVPYDAGCVVLRDEAVLRATFARRAQPSPSGLSAGEPWPVDLGPELSRGFRALKVWMTMRVFGADRLAQVVEHSCAMAERLAGIITMSPQFDLLSPVALNVVCFRLPGCNDVAHEAIASWLQDAGRSILSTTRIGGRRAFRAAFVNHRTAEIDVDALIPDILDACSALKIRLRCGPAVLS